MGFGKVCFSWVLYQEVNKYNIVIREDISPRIQRNLLSGQLIAYMMKIFWLPWLQLTRVLKFSHGRLVAEVNKEIIFLDTLLYILPPVILNVIV